MSLLSNNPWVGYADRDYSVMKAQVIAKMQNPLTGIPEITDHSESNPFIKRLSIWCGINTLLGYYVDNKGREAFLSSARIYRSVVNLAKQYDYRIRGRIAATGQVKFTLSIPAPSAFSIPIGTEVATETGVTFLTLQAASFAIGETTKTVDIKQWQKVPSSVMAVSDGQPSQKIVLNEKIVDGSVAALVDNITPFSPVDSFVLQTATDNVFVGQMNYDSVFEVEFGDGLTGAIPANTKDIALEWSECEGSAGNVGAGTIVKINTTLTLPVGVQVAVTNQSPTVGGTDVEAIKALRKNIPLSLRTLYRAVTEQDYVDVTELAPGVARAGVSYSCGKYVDVYIAPNGGGIASPALLASTTTFLDERRMVTTFIRCFSAGLVYIEYELAINALPNFYNAQVEADVQQAMEDFHDVQNQRIKGKIFLGDIYQLIENVKGVDNSQVLLMRPVPYARPLDLTSPQLSWTRQQTTTSGDATYQIIFVTTTDFKLLRNNVYVGTFSTGAPVSTADITFTITNPPYTAGNKYEFKTYAVAGSVILDEPSLPAFDVAYFTINVTGGLI